MLEDGTKALRRAVAFPQPADMLSTGIDTLSTWL